MKRRSFLKGLLTAGAAAAVAPQILPKVLASSPPPLAIRKASVQLMVSQELLEDNIPLQPLIQRMIEDAARETERKALND